LLPDDLAAGGGARDLLLPEEAPTVVARLVTGLLGFCFGADAAASVSDLLRWLSEALMPLFCTTRLSDGIVVVGGCLAILAEAACRVSSDSRGRASWSSLDIEAVLPEPLFGVLDRDEGEL
jgi:hypothetical protein